MNNYPTPIAVAFTPNYFVPAATCLHSIFSHTGMHDHLHIICLLSEELPERLKQKLYLIGAGRVTYSFINMQGRLKDIYVDSKYTEATSYRLLLPDLLPEYDRVIYIDCDVIVRNDLAALFRSVDMQDYYLAGVFETPLDFQIAHWQDIGCTPGEYINAGFTIMNLESMRRDDMVRIFLEASKADYLEFPDQDVLNMTCKGRILGLPPYYNCIRTFYLPQYKKFFLQKYTNCDWVAIHKHGTVHYTGAKPWHYFTVEFRLWWEYYQQLPDAIKEEWEVNKKIYFLYKFYNTYLGARLVDASYYLYRKIKYGMR